MRIKGNRLATFGVIVLLFLAVFLAGYFIRGAGGSAGTIDQASDTKKNYYISFDDYYYEVPKQKTVDDRLLLGSQFLYNFGAAVKANTLDDIFNDGAIGVQALIPLNGDDKAFEHYLEALKPSTASAFGGTADLKFGQREKDKVRTADLIAKKDGKVVRRQYLINLPQSVAVISIDNSDAFKRVGESVGRASASFADYEEMKTQVLSQSFMLRNRMFDDIYRIAHEDLRGATSVDELNRIAERNTDLLNQQAQVSGVTLRGGDMTATVHFSDPETPSITKTGSLTFRRQSGDWKLITLKLPNGSVTGIIQESDKQVQ